MYTVVQPDKNLWITVSIDPITGMRIEGQDLSPGLWDGVGEYEYSYGVAARSMPALRDAVGVATNRELLTRFEEDPWFLHRLRGWCQEQGIPTHGFWSHLSRD